MKYVALLRGINVGGNNMIKMSDLKKTFEDNGFTNVSTYINSGNVIFDSKDLVKIITDKLEKVLSKRFGYNARLIVLSIKQLQHVMENIPDEWKKENDLRCYIAFVKESVKMSDVISNIALKEDVDMVKEGEYVLYMSTNLSGITKSGFSKINSKKIFQDITIRNYTTSKKLLELMEKTNTTN